MFPVPSQLSTIPWADIYRSPTSFFVDLVIPAGSPSMDRIENMKCSSMIKLADRIRLVQQSDRPNIFRVKADILRILRSSPSKAVAPKTPSMGVNVIDVDALPSPPSLTRFESSRRSPPAPLWRWSGHQPSDCPCFHLSPTSLHPSRGDAIKPLAVVPNAIPKHYS